MNNKFILNLISFICASIVPLLVLGPFLPDLVISLLSFWFLYYSLRNKIFYIYKNYYFIVFVCFCLVCIISSLFSDDIFFSLKGSIFYFRIGIFALLISFLIDKNKKIIDYFYYAFIITFFSLIVDGYFQYFSGFNLFGYKIQDHNRISSFFGSELILGSFLSRLFPLFFALFIVKKKKHPSEIYFVALMFILIYLLILLSGERNAFFFINIFVFFIIIFTRQYKLLTLTIFFISLLLIVLIFFYDSKLYDRHIKSPVNSIINKKFIFTEAHDSLIRTGWNMFLDKPILGHGPKFFRVKCKDQKFAHGSKPCDNHPHNFYVQLLAETGLVGFSFLAGLFFYFIYLITVHIKKYFINNRLWLSDYQICLLAGLLITIIPFTTNGNFFTNYLMLFYGLQMGFFRKNLN